MRTQAATGETLRQAVHYHIRPAYSFDPRPCRDPLLAAGTAVGTHFDSQHPRLIRA